MISCDHTSDSQEGQSLGTKISNADASQHLAISTF